MTGQSVVLVVGVLAGVLALIFTATRIFQSTLWRTKPRHGKTLMLRELIALDPRRRIHLVQCGDRQVVVLTGGGTDIVIGWMPDS